MEDSEIQTKSRGVRTKRFFLKIEEKVTALEAWILLGRLLLDKATRESLIVGRFGAGKGGPVKITIFTREAPCLRSRFRVSDPS